MACCLRPRRYREGETPDYRDHSEHGPWAAWPSRSCGSCALQPEDDPGAPVKPEASRKSSLASELRADCFYVHPTSFGVLHNVWRRWNGPTSKGGDRASDFVLEAVLGMQASAFTAGCRIYAPRYRQVCLGAYFHGGWEDMDRIRATDLAYEDVRAAFLHFLDHRVDPDGPFVIASHSQGTMHCLRLLTDVVDRLPAAQKLACAYLPGYSLPRDAFTAPVEAEDGAPPPDSLRVYIGDRPEATQCVVAWDSMPADAPLGASGRTEDWLSGYGEHAYATAATEDIGAARQELIPHRDSVGKPRLVVNPLTWRTTPEEAGGEHLGLAVLRVTWRFQFRLRRVVPEKTPKVYVRGDFLVLDPVETWWPAHAGSIPSIYRNSSFGSYHSIDIPLFFENIRQNVVDRVRAWHRRNEAAAADGSVRSYDGSGSVGG